MSIIQEALKKVQGHKVPREPVPQKPDTKVEETATTDTPFAEAPIAQSRIKIIPKNSLLLTGILALILVALSLVALRQFLFNKKSVKKEAMQQETVSHQEVIYKPLPAANTAAPVIETKTQPPDLLLNGIMYLEDGPRAIINNSIVTVGDTVGGATVTKILRRSVTLEFNNTEITLNLK